MEYRSFEYTNDLGQVELERGSVIGTALSWGIIQLLKIALLAVIAGLGFCILKYADPALNLDSVAALISHRG